MSTATVIVTAVRAATADRALRRGGVTCFECGKKGHKGFECKADEETRKAYKESRRNG